MFQRDASPHLILYFLCGNDQIDIENPDVRARVVGGAIRRASKWMTLSREDAVKPLRGQVGGASVHKKPLLTLEPDYVLKPLLGDHRGVREIAFYEAMAIGGSKEDGGKAYRNFVKGSPSSSSTGGMINSNTQMTWLQRIGDWMDTLAVFGAFFLHDPVVMTLEEELDAASRTVKAQLKKESELLRKLVNLTPSYYGVWGQEEFDPSEPFGVGEEAHLLLNNITINYVYPCVMDLKLGTQTYEPDAPLAKKDREGGKYKAQADIGFRIVGMRVYHPRHPESDGTGFRFWNKEYGRSLDTVDQVKDALRQFFTVTSTSTASNEAEQQEAIAEPETAPKAHTGGNNGAIFTTEKDEAADTNAEDAVSHRANATSPTPREPLLRTKAISSLLMQVRSVRRWFDENDCFQFYASSLLIVYEGDRSAPDVTALKMIDFGRVRRQSGGDKGYQKGLRTLKHLLADLLDEEEERMGHVRPR